MCLIIDPILTKPKRGQYRWKFLVCNKRGTLSSPSKSYTWSQTRPNRARPDSNPTNGEGQVGFHVFTNRRDAERASKHWPQYARSSKFVAVKLKVNDFKYAGTIEHCDDYSNGRYGEVWGEATVVRRYNIRNT